MTTFLPDGVPPLPGGTRLLHIGPHKTGTTSLQAALWASRDAMREQGVRLAGRSRNPVGAARAITGEASSYSDKPPPMREWRQLVRDITGAAEPRVVVSSEFFAHADVAAVRRVIDDLDPKRIHVTITLRPLVRVIPSMWQQNVQAGILQSLDRWVHGLFPEPPTPPNQAFWKLHRHDELIERWASVVGLDNVTVIVVDEQDHAYVLRAFERLLGLPAGILPLEHDLANRSLTLPETEAVRAFNRDFRDAGHGRALHARVMRYGAAQHMKLRIPDPTERAICLPDWALTPVAEISREVNDRIVASGVRVMGDLASLASAPAPTKRVRVRASSDRNAPPSVAARMTMGVLLSSGRMRREAADPGGVTAAAAVPTYVVAGAIATRAQTGLAATWHEAGRTVGLLAHRAALTRSRPGARPERGDQGSRYGMAQSMEIQVTEPMQTMPIRDQVPLPEGTRLVHIGPPKTGTTALQGAFHAARAAAEAQGVHYAGRQRHSMTAVQAVLGRPGFYTKEGPPPIKHWRKLVDEIRASDAKRVVMSSEFFADATPEAIRRVVDDLDASRVRVVVTLRPLAKIIPSQWQQYVQSNLKVSFDDWLDAMLNLDQTRISPSFWNRHRHDRLIARWAEVVGTENMTVIALDEGDHGFVLRALECLTGLTPGTLVPVADAENRSLTMPEVEAVRAFNIAFRDEGLGRPLHSRIMNFGAARYMRGLEPPADALRVEPPQWALDKAGVVAREMVDAIAASGVRVIGDLEPLAAVPTSRLAGDRQPPITVPPAVAASMAMGVLYASGLATEAADGAGDGRKGWTRTSAVPIRGEPMELVRVPTRDLVALLVRRGRASLRRRVPGGKKKRPD